MAETVEPATAATGDSDTVMGNVLDAQQQQNSPLTSSSEDVSGTIAVTPGTGGMGTEPSDLPAAFPVRRRGRPPGRPNMTVKEADFEDNPLVQKWNSAKTDVPISVHAVSIRDALTEASLVHETQKDVFKMPSREVIYFVSGWITARHIASRRPSYVNGLLIHSRGNDATTQCVQCVDRRVKNALGPFPSCRTLPGKYGDSCSNCKWFDNTSSCSLYTGPRPNRKRKSKASREDESLEGEAAERNRNGNGNARGPEEPVDGNPEESSPTTNEASNHHLLHPDLLEPVNQGSDNSNSSSHQNDSPIAGITDESE
ncbi:hypothetical protein QBC43DRAFT_316803 [Cladorrhinum sp. PSN259]|nr:hypothetical protein QBC43DRAFT_316803 [Cladorrhinum sp. PSN259]